MISIPDFSDPVLAEIARRIQVEEYVHIWVVPLGTWEIREYSVRDEDVDEEDCDPLCWPIEVFDTDHGYHDGIRVIEDLRHDPEARPSYDPEGQLSDLGHIFLSPREAAQFILDQCEG